MTDRGVELHVAGQKCRVVTTASEEELQQLADMVEEKIAGVWPEGRPVTTQALLLAAIALAADVRDSKEQSTQIESHARKALGGLLQRVDGAIANSETIAQEREGRRKQNSNRGIAAHAQPNPPSDEPSDG
jgi:cell division protein ZapA